MDGSRSRSHSRPPSRGIKLFSDPPTLKIATVVQNSSNANLASRETAEELQCKISTNHTTLPLEGLKLKVIGTISVGWQLEGSTKADHSEFWVVEVANAPFDIAFSREVAQQYNLLQNDTEYSTIHDAPRRTHKIIRETRTSRWIKSRCGRVFSMGFKSRRGTIREHLSFSGTRLLAT
ncbi:uncharacterized protein K452DRAFT_355790 [Aplosporella prunicola CBS 121167]|uniref:Uncharacterized protein n=1 Tax=Aplosporella prunicola CBS 121167 TaxID=1176127 RepID=A0A6A6BQK2_9PEZI|nr:uncharacterized protein K452DRAFT_355790 [Aplosporella prunicola CBS 121167]KAF2146402.1 hypothetical protein K452DRAFT_355790 [Aplosporella prunicola CBS 121167]